MKPMTMNSIQLMATCKRLYARIRPFSSNGFRFAIIRGPIWRTISKYTPTINGTCQLVLSRGRSALRSSVSNQFHKIMYCIITFNYFALLSRSLSLCHKGKSTPHNMSLNLVFRKHIQTHLCGPEETHCIHRSTSGARRPL